MADARRYYVLVAFKPAYKIAGGVRVKLKRDDVDARWRALHGKLGRPSLNHTARWRNTWPT